MGFTKAIAGNFRLDGIRVNVLCPGIVQTNLLDKKGWSGFPAELFTDVSDIASIVCKLIDGADITDSKGRTVTGDKLYGQVVEVNIGKFYFRDQPEFSDAKMKSIMMATSVENQLGAVLTS